MSTRGGRAGGAGWDSGYLTATIHAVRHRWLLVLCTALVLSALTIAVAGLRDSGYTAESLVRVQSFGGGGAQEVSTRRIQEIRAAAGPEEMSRTAMQSIGWEAGIAEFEQSLGVEVTREGRLDIFFSAETPDAAAEGANAYARSFVERVGQMDQDRLAGGSLNAGAEVARQASPPSSPDVRLAVVGLVALIPGLAVGTVLALMLRVRNQSWRNAGDAEITLGAPVLGVIPEYGGHDPAELEPAGDGVV
jgi:capsular polysaccharide biosynthesis protein